MVKRGRGLAYQVFMMAKKPETTDIHAQKPPSGGGATMLAALEGTSATG